MPYDKVKDHPECGQGKIAVVSPSGKVLGCHESEEDANEQIAALNAQEKNSLYWVDQYSADRVLSGEPVMLLPLLPGGYHRWGTERDPITEEILAQFLANFQNRSNIAGMVANIPLNVEHDDLSGKIGNIADLQVREDGLYAIFELTPTGQGLLDDGKFEYLSPEIIWDFEDIATGQSVGPVIVGAAVTNYPFFGQSTAMYSDRAAGAIVERFALKGGNGDAGIGVAMRALEMVHDVGFRYSDLSSDWSDLPAVVMSHVIDASAANPASRLQFVVGMCDTQREGDAYYPRSAYLEIGAGQWRYRVKAYNEDHCLREDGCLIQQAYDAMVEAEPDLVAGHSGLFESFVDTTNQEVASMSDNEQVVTAEQFAQMQERMDKSAGEIETLTRQLLERDSQLEQMRNERVVERYAREAEGYAALGVDRDQYAAHFAWLEGVDPDGEHLAWFKSVMQSADGAMAQSDAFRARGSGEQAPAADPFARIEQEMKKKATERGITLRVGTDDYNTIMTEVMNERPDLVEAYRGRLVSGPSEPATE